MIYINPKLEIVKTFAIEPWSIDQSIRRIIKLRRAIRENDFPRLCSDVKYAMCHMCTPSECGLFKVDDNLPFEHYAPRVSERFVDIYEQE